MQITALCIVSVSEIAKVRPDITYKWIEENNHEFLDMLNDLGMNTAQPIELQREIQHKNRFNEIVICDRYVGNQRTDKLWINSGYASVEAKDKASGNKLLKDLYRLKGQVE
jgi:hypothetical protein